MYPVLAPIPLYCIPIFACPKSSADHTHLPTKCLLVPICNICLMSLQHPLLAMLHDTAVQLASMSFFPSLPSYSLCDKRGVWCAMISFVTVILQLPQSGMCVQRGARDQQRDRRHCQARHVNYRCSFFSNYTFRSQCLQGPNGRLTQFIVMSCSACLSPRISLLICLLTKLCLQHN